VTVAGSLSNLKPNPAWATLPLFDRTGWKRVRFGDVVENCAETCDPAEAGLERFVAMEHLEPGLLHVRSWGNVADGTTFTRRCRPGQVLFGKRRAYQRKVAVAKFEAVVSGDIYVLAPKDTQTLLPELLPFLCLSERFFQHAVGTSAGSLSPRTNWSSLASFEFDLPPLDQQRRIAEILWAVDEVRMTFLKVLDDIRAASDSTKSGISGKGSVPMPLEQIATLITKGESPLWQGFDYQDSGPLFVTSENVLFGEYAPEPRKHIPEEFHKKLRRSSLCEGDILFNLTGASIGRGCVLPLLNCEANINQNVALIRLNRALANPDFVLSYLLSSEGMKPLLGSSGNTARASITLGNLRTTRIPLPEIEIQESVASQVSKLRKLQVVIDRQVEAVTEIGRALSLQF
jgi:type I restriction enzyme S subunit